MFKTLLFIQVVLFSQGCYCSTCPYWFFEDQTYYDVSPSKVSQLGIPIDDSGWGTNPNDVDEIVVRVLDCLAGKIPGGHIPSRMMQSSQCIVNHVDIYKNVACLTVKIAPTYIMSCDGEWQLLPDPAPERLCYDKGLLPDTNCPCRWRVGLQDQTTAVVTPDLRMLPDGMVRALTGCSNPWTDLAECASPLCGD